MSYNGPKKFAIEFKCAVTGADTWCDWRLWQRYKTKEAMENAMKVLKEDDADYDILFRERKGNGKGPK